MNKPTYTSGEPMNLFDGVLVQRGQDSLQHPGTIIGFPQENQVTVALVGARYCESDGRKEASELGELGTFLRADAGILCVETAIIQIETSKLALSSAWSGPSTAKRGVIAAPNAVIFRPGSASHSAA